MQYVSLGGCGLKVWRIGLGMMSYGDPAVQRCALAEDSAEPIVRQAVEAGVTFFDTADIYTGPQAHRGEAGPLRRRLPAVRR